jgi:hypothetical protein
VTTTARCLANTLC